MSDELQQPDESPKQISPNTDDEKAEENSDQRRRSDVISFPSRLSVNPCSSSRLFSSHRISVQSSPCSVGPQRSERSVHWKQPQEEEGTSENPNAREDEERIQSNEDRVHVLERDSALLQQRLTTEVARAVRKWRGTSLGNSLESHNDALEEIVRRLESIRDRSRPRHDDADDFGGGGIVRALQQENVHLRAELERLRRLHASEHTVQKLRDIQNDIRGLQERVHRLQEEASEKKASHGKELQRRLTELRRLRHLCDGVAEAVRRGRAEEAELRARARTQHDQPPQQDQPLPPSHSLRLPLPSGTVDLQLKAERARMRLQRTQRELEEKRRHPKKFPHSVDSLEDLCAVWTERIRLLERLQRRDAERARLRDRVQMFRCNLEILRKENDALEAQLHEVHEQVSRFVDNPMTPTVLVEKNVNLLLHMETIESTLAEKAVELDKQEKELQLEQNKVREVVIALEHLRRENRHLSRRLQKHERMQDAKETLAGKPSTLGTEHAERAASLGSQTLSMCLLPTPMTSPTGAFPIKEPSSEDISVQEQEQGQVTPTGLSDRSDE